MRRISLLVFLMFAGQCALAQSYGRLDFTLQNAQGQAIAGATINVYSETACGVPQNGTQAQLYSSATGGAISQPLYTDGFGSASAYAAPGCVTVVYYSNYTGTRTFIDQNVIAGSTISIPVSVLNGGTGATTTAGALANLGGVSALATTPQTMVGPLNLPELEGTLYADQFQTPALTGNNGIANSLTDCLSLAYPCSIIAPALYSQTEVQPFGGAPNNWYNIFLTLGPTSSQPTASFLDERWGVPEWIFNQSNPLSNRFLAQPTIAMNNISGPGQGLSAHYPNALMLMNFAFAGGRNDSNLVAGLGDKTNLSTLWMATYHFTQTQGAGAISNMVYCYGNGDCIPNTSYSYSAGGPNTSGDEGNRTVAAYAVNSPYVYQGSVSSVATLGDGSVTVTTTPSQGAGTQGEGRLAIDLSQVYNGVANSNYISSITGASNNLILTCAGTCNWDSLYGDSTQTTLTSNIGNGASPVNTFPQSSAVLSVASSAGFTVGSLACIFDYDYECEKITAVGTGTVTLATLRIPHTSGAYVTTGGMAGYALELEADRVNPGALNGLMIAGDTSLLNMSRLAIPVMYNTSGNLLTLFTSGQTLPGHAGTYAGRAYVQMGSGGTVTLTVVGGVVTACTASGGTGYGTAVTTYPPQLVVSGTYTTAPTAWIISTTSGGALSTCGFTPGVGVTAATVAVTPTNSYDIYPASKIYGVYNAAAGAVDGTLYTEPWPVAPSVADVVESPHYFVQTNNPLVLTSQQYIPALANLARFGQSTTMTGVMGGNDAFSIFYNNTNPTVYKSYPAATPWVLGLGQLNTPNGIELQGPVNRALRITTPPFGTASGVVEVDCLPITCATWTLPYQFARLENSVNGYDGLSYQPSTGNTAWTSTSPGSLQAGWSATPASYFQYFSGAYRYQLFNNGQMFSNALMGSAGTIVTETDGLMGWWKICGDTTVSSGCTATTSTAVFDSSVNINNGTWQGTQSGTTGWYNSTAATTNFIAPWDGVFDGTDNYIKVPNLAAQTPVSKVTLSAWVYMPTVPSTGDIVGIVAKDNGINNPPYSLYFNGNTLLPVFEINTASNTEYVCVPVNQIAVNTWTLLTGTYNSTTGIATLYVNGVNVCSVTASGTLYPATGTINIGAGRTNDIPARMMIGQENDVRIYNRVLSQGEISQMVAELPNVGIQGLYVPAQLGVGGNATTINSAAVPVSAALLGSNGSGQLVVATAPAPVAFKLAGAPLDNTGSTTSNFIGAVTIPAGTMGTTSQLHVVSRVGACGTTSGQPNSFCTGTANTGTCSLFTYFNTTSGSSASGLIEGVGAAVADSASYDITVANLTASTQQADFSEVVHGNFTNAGGYSGLTTNTAVQTYINFFMQNSVSGDKCAIDSVFVELIP